MKRQLVFLAASAAVLLAGCNSDDSDSNIPAPGSPGSPSTTEVPASAGASAQAYLDFAKTLVNSETALPLSLDRIAVPPTTETGSPGAL